MPSLQIWALRAAATLGFFLLVASGLARADPNVLFIFDASGSMKKTLEDGQSRIDVAKAAVASALAESPAELRLGLLLYGHRRAKDCSDIELVSPIGADDATTIAERVRRIEARGETPIAEALSQGIGSFAALKGQSNRIVLVTDGIEECGGDPCAAAQSVVDAGLDLKVDVVGFRLTADQRATVQCVADLTGGSYHDAQDVSGLTTALAEVRRDLVVAAPAEPALTEYFRDEFEGESLDGNWEVLNPNPDMFLVEDGELLVVSPGKAGSLLEDNIPNIFRLSKALPDGDWVLTARIIPEFQTGQEDIFLGLHESKDNYLLSRLVVHPDPYYGHKFLVRAAKRSGAEEPAFDGLLFGYSCNVCGDEQHISKFVKDVSKPILLSLTKQGRSYVAAAQWEGTDGNGQPYPRVQTEKLTSLKGGGDIVIGIVQTGDSTGESLVTVDWVKIETR